MLTLLTIGAALAGDRVHVRDLDPAELPAELAWDVRRAGLVVDGRRVRGSRLRQLTYLDEVLGRPASLDLEGRIEDLRERNEGLAAGQVGLGLSVVGLAVPGVGLPLVVAGLGTEVVGVVSARRAWREFDSTGLAREVELLHELRTDALVMP